jgi:hypothetical protein
MITTESFPHAGSAETLSFSGFSVSAKAKIFSGKRMSSLAMCFGRARMFFLMFLSRNQFKVPRVAAGTGVASVVKYFILGNRTNKPLIGQLMNSFIDILPHDPAVSLEFASGPYPAIGFWVDRYFLLKSNREILQHAENSIA